MLNRASLEESSGAKPNADERLVLQTFARLDKVALGTAMGCLGALVLLTATAILLLNGGDRVGPTLALLGQFFPGYSVTWRGSVVGAAYGLLAGFMLGWTIAALRNAIVGVCLRVIRLRAQLSAVQSMIDDA
jgi:hypothetical protein